MIVIGALISCSNMIGWGWCLAGTFWTVNLDLHILTFSVVKIPSASEHSSLLNSPWTPAIQSSKWPWAARRPWCPWRWPWACWWCAPCRPGCCRPCWLSKTLPSSQGWAALHAGAESALLYRTRFVVDRDKPRQLTHAFLFLAAKSAAHEVPICGGWWLVGVMSKVEINLSPFKCQLFHLLYSVYTCTINLFNKHMYSKLVLYTVVQ